MRHQCYFCHTRTVEKLIEKHKPCNGRAEEFVFRVNKLLSDNRKLSNPYLSTLIHRLAKEMIHNEDLYSEEKRTANCEMLNHYSFWENEINRGENPLYMAAKLAVAGNIIDYGAHSVSRDVKKQIDTIIKQDFAIDETGQLFKKIKESKKILYLGDNAGEIVFDKLFIQTMGHSGITYVVRGKPVINDVTFDDSIETGINGLCKVISNGYDAPSTVLEYCTEEFVEHFNSSDLIISKGQGNFEGLVNNKKQDIFFMLIAKCEPMAELIGVSKGDMVIKGNKRI